MNKLGALLGTSSKSGPTTKVPAWVSAVSGSIGVALAFLLFRSAGMWALFGGIAAGVFLGNMVYVLTMAKPRKG